MEVNSIDYERKRCKLMKKFVIYCHCDNDGHAAGYWCKRWVVENFENPEIEIIPINYGDLTDFRDIDEDTVVFIVDFSFEQPEVMEELITRTKKVIWIDHHISAINKYNERYADRPSTDFNPCSVSGIRQSGVAGCALTYYYLYGKSEDGYNANAEELINLFKEDGSLIVSWVDDKPEEEIRHLVYIDMPDANIAIADNDIWAFEMHKTKEFISAVGFLNCTTDDGYERIDELMKSHTVFDKIVEKGEILRDYKMTELYPIMCKAAHEVDLDIEEGPLRYAKCIAINMPFCFNSEVFDSIEKEYDIYIKYNQTPSGWSYTFYSKPWSKVTALDVATHFGGGGHKDAAGAKSDNLIFTFTPIDYL